MAEYKPKIIAETIEEFQEISDKLSKFSSGITSQFETVRRDGHFGLVANFRQTYESDKKFWLPSTTTQISDFGDYIGIYATGIFMKIDGDMYKSKKSYVISKD
jgi:hypothetical protein